MRLSTNMISLNLYPATTTNALLQSTKYTYEYSNGKAKRITNPNGGVVNNIYDGIGRLIEVDQSNLAKSVNARHEHHISIYRQSRLCHLLF